MAAHESRIAFFLDFENLVTNTGITAASFDLQPTVDRLLEKGKVIYRRAYADWSRFKEAKLPLHEIGFELVDVPPSTRAGKNGADMRLVIDALELCYAREYIDTFVIGSGDSDFLPLAYKLRENDRVVIGVGVKDSTSRLFVKACDEFIYLKPPAAPRRKTATEEPTSTRRRRTTKQQTAAAKATTAPEPDAPAAVAEPAPEPPAPESKPAAQARPRRGRKEKEQQAKGTQEKGKQEKEKPREKERAIPAVAREVVSSLLARATGPINPSLIKETIVRKQPDFDEREHGFSTFTKLLEAMERDGLLRRQQIKGRQWYVVPPDAPLAPAVAVAEGAPAEPAREELPG